MADRDYTIVGPDGRELVITGPDTASPAELRAAAERAFSVKAEPPPVVRAGSAIRELPRQGGLTVRAGVKAAAAIPAMMADAATGIYNTGADLIAGEGNGYRFRQQMPELDKFLTRLGVPEPANSTERVAGDAASMVIGAGGMAKAADVASRGAVGVSKTILNQLAARPAVQMAGAGAAGLAGGSVREAGGGPGEQFAAALGGGLLGGLGAAKAVDAAGSLRAALTPAATKMQQADVRISMLLQRSGIDWSQVPERIRQGVRAEAAEAMKTGADISPEALRRLLVFKQTNTTPTVGMLTQDPGAITREMNLAKTGANSTDVALQRLPALANQNTRQLLALLDEAGAGRNVSPMDAGRAGVNSLDATAALRGRGINALYGAARDTQGRSLPLEGGTFTRRASELIDEAMAGDSLPKAVEGRLNAIARGEYPLTVASAEALKTRIGKLQRGTSDGNARHALGLVRQALDETPLMGAEKINAGNLPAVPGTVPPSPSAAGVESINAFNAARKANRQWMQQVEGNPALKAVVDGVEPDKFMGRFVVGKGASAAEVERLAKMLDRTAKRSIRDGIAKHLKDAATGGDSDIVKFGGKAYRDAFRAIEEKLPSFFSPEEISQLRAVGETAKYMQAQPAGSAVNNSNSGALMLGRGLDMLDAAANYVPLGGRDIIKGRIQGLQQAQVLAPRNALALPLQRQPAPINPLMAALLAPTPANSRDDDRRNKPAK